MPLGAALAAAIPSLIGWGSQMLTNRSERKEARKMRDYNAPKAQMGRFAEAGLSPYLMYGQGNPGNQTAPIPAQQYGGEHVGKGIGEYLSLANFQADMGIKHEQTKMLKQQNRAYQWTEAGAFAKAMRQQLDMFADYPGTTATNLYGGGTGDLNQSFRRKINELKLAASQAAIDRMGIQIEGMNYKNTVDRVKANYAEDFGMVGGDWTQGLGLLKSLPRMFNKSSKAIPGKAISGGFSKSPWNTSLRVNPRRRPSRGVVNP